jgi:uncharacterized protein (TIGR03435 family)
VFRDWPPTTPIAISRQLRGTLVSTGLYQALTVEVGEAPRTLLDQGRLTMFEAVDKMLGLKLDSKKLPMQVVVVDHAEKLADN